MARPSTQFILLGYGGVDALDHLPGDPGGRAGRIAGMQTFAAGLMLDQVGPPDGRLARSRPIPRVEMRNASGHSDANWIDLIAAIASRQDKAAFKALFEFFAPRVKTMLMRSGASGDMAEDIAQETLVVVFNKASYYDPARASLAAWIFTIARNIRIDRLRRDQRARRYLALEQPETIAPEQSDARLDAVEREQRVQNAIDDLPEEQARVVELSFFEGRAHGEIARVLDIPLGTVKSRLRLAMTRLREALDDFR